MAIEQTEKGRSGDEEGAIKETTISERSSNAKPSLVLSFFPLSGDFRDVSSSLCSFFPFCETICPEFVENATVRVTQRVKLKERFVTCSLTF